MIDTEASHYPQEASMATQSCTRLSPFAIAFLVLLAPSASSAICNPDFEDCGPSGFSRCGFVCPSAGCDESCVLLNGTATTCAQFYGFPANDFDGDGIGNASDNCLCTPNTNQANCDGDASGDVCDANNAKWVFVQDIGRCDWDEDIHLTKFTIEQYAAIKYKNVCTGTFCFDRYISSSKSCNFSGSGCGSSAGACCTCNYPLPWCSASTGCGSPACPF